MRETALLVAVALSASMVAGQEQAQEPTAEEQIARLEAAIARVEETYADKDSLVYQVDMPLARLKLRKAKVLKEKPPWGFVEINVDDQVEEGLAMLAMLERGERYQPPRRKLSELAYMAHNDGTVQPYYVHIPEKYDEAQPWPLIVFLHGYVPSITMVDPWVLSEDFCQVAEDNGCILMIPYGRRNTDFQGVGEVDVFRSIEETRRLYNIDPSRIYLSGVSMGGMGTWTIGLRNPGVFAALCPMSGQTDMFRWWRWEREQMTPFKQFLVEWDNAMAMAPNLRGQDFFCQHGENDMLIPVIESRSMVELAEELGTPVKYYEFKGQSHYIYWDLPCFRNAWGWCKDFTLSPSPKHIAFKCYNLNYGRCFWLTIERFERWGTPATVEARVTDEGRLEVTSDNVAALAIDLRTCPVERAERYGVTVNGQEMALAMKQASDPRLEVGAAAPAESGWPPVKRKGLCGPPEDVFNTPFILVQGTAGNDQQNDLLARQTGIWADEWDRFADGQPRVCTDQELTEEEIQRYNLVLFGTPETNSIVARIADKLPVTIGDHKYTVAGKTYEGGNLGLVLCYPNPLAPDRYVLIYAGELYGRKCDINHKHDMLPDFLIFDCVMVTTGKTEKNVCGGWFDVDWLPKEDLTWEGDEEGQPAAEVW